MAQKTKRKRSKGANALGFNTGTSLDKADVENVRVDVGDAGSWIDVEFSWDEEHIYGPEVRYVSAFLSRADALKLAHKLLDIVAYGPKIARPKKGS
jgi:hypothetical protein